MRIGGEISAINGTGSFQGNAQPAKGVISYGIQTSLLELLAYDENCQTMDILIFSFEIVKYTMEKKRKWKDKLIVKESKKALRFPCVLFIITNTYYLLLLNYEE